MKFKIYNTLSKKIETFQPFSLPQVKIYTCGPTVYDDLTIGNWRTYTLSDLLVRTLKIFGFKPKYIMNITDVGHLTGDNLGDADLGEDKMEKAAKKENKTAWDVAEFYTQSFKQGYKQLNLTEPEKFTKATDHIQEQINLVKQIYKKGFSYKTKDGIYFDVQAYEKAGNKYGQLSTLDKIKEGARVARNPDKKDPRDFALWKFSPKNEQRQMEWDSPWGKGFPGWHIECSAMSMKYLGDQLDIHVGGEDLKSIHHPNEIAQSEAATGKKPFVKYWVHGAFLLVNGGRMGKSLGNAYTLKDIKNKNFEFLTLRYFYLTGHYRKQLNFTWQALKASQTAFFNLKQAVLSLRAQSQTSRVSEISP
jgi:cysteinyl-tRNA synthetase